MVDESTIRLLLTGRQQESLTVYTDGFRAYEPLDEDDAFEREYIVHGDGEYADGAVHVNTCESHGSLLRPWPSPHRDISLQRFCLESPFSSRLFNAETNVLCYRR